MKSIEHILIATDFSEAALPALKLGSNLAKHLDAKATLVHVLHHTAATRMLHEAYATWTEPTEGHESGEDVAKRLEGLAQQVSFRPKLAVIWGHAVEAIRAYAADHDVDLVVLGSHGASGVAALTVGSTAERVARRAGCSVLVARGEGELPKRILIGTDLSGAGREGVHAGVLLAEECGAYATLAHVHVASGPRPELVSDEAQLVLRRKLGQLAERQPISVETKLLVDEHPVTGLMSFAEDEDTDVIVVAAQGLSAMERLLIGSVSERLVRHAPCSVLVAR